MNPNALTEAQSFLTEACIETAFNPVKAMRHLRQSMLSLEGVPLDENFRAIMKEQCELATLLASKIELRNRRETGAV